jgi:DNA gyrase subunit A
MEVLGIIPSPLVMLQYMMQWKEWLRISQAISLNLTDGRATSVHVTEIRAAMRYTESRLTKIAVEMLADINKETVDFKSNFDDHEMEPVVMPSRFPNLLVNGSSGIAVGMATNIPTHNLTEIIDAISSVIKNPDITIDDLIEIVKGPDFPTYGTIKEDPEYIRHIKLEKEGL